MKPFRMTVKQLTDACNKYDYILCRYADGDVVGMNTKIATIAKRKKRYAWNAKTAFVGYIPCDFQTYITFKQPFIK